MKLLLTSGGVTNDSIRASKSDSGALSADAVGASATEVNAQVRATASTVSRCSTRCTGRRVVADSSAMSATASDMVGRPSRRSGCTGGTHQLM